MYTCVKMADEVYCVKCREKTENDGEGKVELTKNGRRCLKVKCLACGTKKCKFLPKEE